MVNLRDDHNGEQFLLKQRGYISVTSSAIVIYAKKPV